MVDRPSFRPILALLIAAFVTTGLSGCIGGDDEVSTKQIPRAVMEITPVEGKEFTYYFDGTASTGQGLTYFWDFGDRSGADDPALEHAYAGGGVYEVTLTVVDANGVTDITRLEEPLVVGDGKNAVPVADFQPQFRYYGVGEPILVDATATKDPDGDDIVYLWDFNYFMDESQYMDFREKKQTTQPEEQGGDNGTIEASAFPTPRGIFDQILGGLTDSPGHAHGGGDGIASSSVKEIRKESDEPVYTLDTGLPEEGYYFIRLQTVDARGAAQPYVSEQVWPIHVVAEKELRFRGDEKPGTLNAGHQPTVQEATPTQEETYQDEDVWEWNIDRPVKTLFVNVTWSGNPTGSAGATENSLDIRLTLPNPDKDARIVQGGNVDEPRTIVLEIPGHTDPGSGKYLLEIFGRMGADIEYTASWWAEVDLNEFRELEAPYTE